MDREHVCAFGTVRAPDPEEDAEEAGQDSEDDDS